MGCRPLASGRRCSGSPGLLPQHGGQLPHFLDASGWMLCCVNTSLSRVKMYLTFFASTRNRKPSAESICSLHGENKCGVKRDRPDWVAETVLRERACDMNLVRASG
jgi:hypothetical protein